MNRNPSMDLDQALHSDAPPRMKDDSLKEAIDKTGITPEKGKQLMRLVNSNAQKSSDLNDAEVKRLVQLIYTSQIKD